MADYKDAANRLLRGARAYRTGTYNEQLDLQNVADAYLDLLQALPPPTCYLTEEDDPKEHDLKRYSAVCGKCYSATVDNHAHEMKVALNHVYQLRTALQKLRNWHKTEYQSNKVLDAEVDTILGMITMQPIPTGVYFSGDNFYSSATREGMGQHFFALWFERRDEFPTEPTITVKLDYETDRNTGDVRIVKRPVEDQEYKSLHQSGGLGDRTGG